MGKYAFNASCNFTLMETWIMRGLCKRIQNSFATSFLNCIVDVVVVEAVAIVFLLFGFAVLFFVEHFHKNYFKMSTYTHTPQQIVNNTKTKSNRKQANERTNGEQQSCSSSVSLTIKKQLNSALRLVCAANSQNKRGRQATLAHTQAHTYTRALGIYTIVYTYIQSHIRLFVCMRTGEQLCLGCQIACDQNCEIAL